MGITTEPEGSEEFIADMQELRPTFLLGMSCFWQDLYSRHLQRLHPTLEQALGRRLSVNIRSRSDSGCESESHRALALYLKQECPALWGELLAHFLRTRHGASLQRRVLRRSRKPVSPQVLAHV